MRRAYMRAVKKWTACYRYSNAQGNVYTGILMLVFIYASVCALYIGNVVDCEVKTIPLPSLLSLPGIHHRNGHQLLSTSPDSDETDLFKLDPYLSPFPRRIEGSESLACSVMLSISTLMDVSLLLPSLLAPDAQLFTSESRLAGFLSRSDGNLAYFFSSAQNMPNPLHGAALSHSMYRRAPIMTRSTPRMAPRVTLVTRLVLSKNTKTMAARKVIMLETPRESVSWVKVRQEAHLHMNRAIGKLCNTSHYYQF